MEGHDNVCCSLVVGEGLTEAEREHARALRGWKRGGENLAGEAEVRSSVGK